MPTLHAQLDELANTFAASVLLAIRRVALEDLLGETGYKRRSSSRGPERSAAAPRGRGGRLARRSPEDVAKTLATIVSLLTGKKGGLRSEQIRETLKLDKRELPAVLKIGLAKKAIRSKGQKRSTTYFAG